jgi:hypothetical protein
MFYDISGKVYTSEGVKTEIIVGGFEAQTPDWAIERARVIFEEKLGTVRSGEEVQIKLYCNGLVKKFPEPALS